MSTKLPVVVIGAGPYGLAVASHLRAQNLETRVFGSPMSTWANHMPAGMFLKSTPSASNISSPLPGFGLDDYLAGSGRAPLHEDEPIPIDTFIAYGRWFQQLVVSDLDSRSVRRVTHLGDHYSLELDDGEHLETTAVVVASGIVEFARRPAVFATLGVALGVETPISHAKDHADLSRFADRHVAIIGAGQSGLETAALLNDLGARVDLIARASSLRWGTPPEIISKFSQLMKPNSPLGPGFIHAACTRLAGQIPALPKTWRLELFRRVLGPSGAWWLRPRFTDAISVHVATNVAGMKLDGSQVTLALRDAVGKTTSLSVDHVIAATGYEVDVDAVDLLEPSLRDNIARVAKAPALSAHFESSVPGLFFAGLSAAPTFGPLLRFVAGTDFAARRVATGVATCVIGTSNRQRPRAG